jgi:3-hydroxyacyl-CoA dehydrogenase (EC 1.1.1.35)
VIEAVPEEYALKVASLRRIEDRVGAEVPIASNTSSISIDGLAAELRFPSRLLGLHFFNPVRLGTRRDRGRRRDRAGHRRVGAGLGGGARQDAGDGARLARLRLVATRAGPRTRGDQDARSGVASADDIDAAMVLGYKHPIGPLRLTDIVGLDVRLGIAEYLHAELGERFAPPQLLRDKVAAGELGRKSGQGFFTWTESGRT